MNEETLAVYGGPADSVFTFAAFSQGPTLVFHPTPSDIAFTISGVDGVLATIGQDGTVKILKEGAAPEAAKAFWKCISSCYQGIMAERDALKLQVEDLEEELEEYIERDWDDS